MLIWDQTFRSRVNMHEASLWNEEGKRDDLWAWRIVTPMVLGLGDVMERRGQVCQRLEPENERSCFIINISFIECMLIYTNKRS